MPDNLDASELAADGDQIPEGVDPPTLEDQLAFLAASEWPTS
jgi:hypothetical protein